MAVTFNQLTKHGTLCLLPGSTVAFDDKGAEEYFIAAGFASKSSKKPDHTFPKGSVEIDPETVFGGGDKIGQKVLTNG